MIKIDDIIEEDYSNDDYVFYLKKHPLFAKNLVDVLNQIKIPIERIWFSANEYHSVYNHDVSNDYVDNIFSLVILKNKDEKFIRIYSPDPNDLLNLQNYQKLIQLQSNQSLDYYIHNNIIKYNFDTGIVNVNIKLNQKLDQINPNQLKQISDLANNVNQLINQKNEKFDTDQLNSNWNQDVDKHYLGFGNPNFSFDFNLEDLDQSQIIIQFYGFGLLDDYFIKTENLNDILKPDAPLRKYLEQFKQNQRKQINNQTIYHKF